MRKLIYLLSISFFAIFFTSCFEEIDNWYSSTSKFDGRFVAATTADNSDYNTTIRDGNEVMIYNSADNVENEIIIETKVAINFATDEAGYPIKGKLKVAGNSSDFKGEAVPNIARSSEVSDNDFYVVIDGEYDYPSNLDPPTSLGEEYPGLQLYARLSVEEGKVIPKGATTIGGNVSDSVYLKMTTYADELIIESYEIPQSVWKDPGTPEYDWRVKAGSRKNADGEEQHWTLAGYRYTGFPEDNPNNQPPIIEK